MRSSSRTHRETRLSARRFDPAELHSILQDRYGPSGWWPGDTPLEVIVGAVLTQNTAWVNVEKAIHTLKSKNAIDLRTLHEMDEAGLAALIRSSGYYNIKARRLKNLVDTIMETAQGDLSEFLALDAEVLRETLLKVNGIGKETADSICCYAGEKTIFVIDAYTRRILTRHGTKVEKAEYDEIRNLFEQGLVKDLTVYKDLHAYLVFVGKEFCRPKSPRCEGCPLKGWER